MKHLHLIGIFLGSFLIGTVGVSLAFGTFGLAPLFKLLVFAVLVGLAINLFFKNKGRCKIRCEADYSEAHGGSSEEE